MLQQLEKPSRLDVRECQSQDVGGGGGGGGDPNIIRTVICECRGLFQHNKWNCHEMVFLQQEHVAVWHYLWHWVLI